MNLEPVQLAGPTRGTELTGSTVSRKLRFSLKTVLVVTAVVAAALGFIAQQRRLAELQAALWRYEGTLKPTSLGASEFRIIERVVVDTSHVKVVTYRIESAGGHFTTLQGNGDSNGSSSKFDDNTQRYVSEATVLFDYLDSQHKVKLMARVGGAHGYSVQDVPADFSLATGVKFSAVDGLHARDAAVELFRWNDTPYRLQLKK